MMRELEDDIRRYADALERTLAGEVSDVDPDRPARSHRTARRDSRAFAIGLAAAIVAVAVVAFVAVRIGDSSPAVNQRDSQPPTSTQQGIARDIQGAWQPVYLVGYAGTMVSRETPPIVSFSHLTWVGSDGCNGISGTYTVGPHGAFHAVPGGQTKIGCDNVPNAEVLSAASHARVVARNTLVLSALDGHVLGRYARSATAQRLDDQSACRAGRPTVIVSLRTSGAVPERPLPGTVIAYRTVGAPTHLLRQCAMSVPKHGTVSVNLAPGSYSIVATSPQYNGGGQCQPPGPVPQPTIIRQRGAHRHPQHVDVVCADFDLVNRTAHGG